jgi:hypothetical protein
MRVGVAGGFRGQDARCYPDRSGEIPAVFPGGPGAVWAYN